MTLKYKLHLDILTMYLRTKNEASKSRFQKIEDKQGRCTDTRTDETKHITTAALASSKYRVVQKRTVLGVCNSRICWHLIPFYIPNCSVFLSSVRLVLYVTVFKYSLRNFTVTTLH